MNSKANINIDNQKTPLDPRVLICVEGLYKKFCKNLKYKMIYGTKDLSGYLFSIQPQYESLRKSEFWAIRDLSFNIYENEITALLGVNGSGKTTLIRMLAGIYDTERGKIEYNKKVNKVISIFGIKSGLHPTLTGKENIFLKGAYFGLSKSEIAKNVDFISSFSGLKDNLNTPLVNYSSGMKTRLAMSIALSIKTDIMYIDEGFNFSDPGFKIKCFDYLKEEYKKEGKALIFATHQLGKIKNLANRILLLQQGKILESTYDIDYGVAKYMELCNEIDYSSK